MPVYIESFKDAGVTDIPAAGGKNASLGELNCLFMRLLFLLLLLAAGSWRAPAPPDLLRPTLVDRFYRQRHGQLFWFGTGGAGRREELLACIDSAAWMGLDSNRYHAAALRQLAVGAT